METDTTTWLEFPKVGRATVEQILASEENKSKKARLWESQPVIAKVNHLSKVVRD